MTTPERDTHEPAVTVAVLNHNGRRLLEVVLPSLAAQHYKDFETMVVDDCSTDDSVQYLREHWPEVRVVGTGTANVGVAAALNIAVGAARGGLVGLLNNDIELDPDWLGEMVAALKRHPQVSSVSCKLLNYWHRDQLDGAGDIFTRDGTAFRRGHGQPDRGQYDHESYVFAPTAGAALYRASALAAVGPFDESFFAYFEDVDWGLRAQLTGHRCRYIPSALAYHMGSATTGGELNRRYFLLHRRNLLAVLIKGAPLGFLLWHAPRILWAQLQIAIRSARDGMLDVHLHALADTLRNTPRWLRARRQIQRSRTIGTAELERLVQEWSC
jgi:GT2 family glycosyltransferase